MNELHYKIGLIGDRKVGKTTLRNAITNDKKPVWLSSVLYGGWFSKITDNIKLKDQEILFKQTYWDIENCPREEEYYGSFSKNLHLGISQYIFVFDLTNLKTLTFIENIYQKIHSSYVEYNNKKPSFPILKVVLIGTFFDSLEPSKNESITNRALELTHKISSLFYSSPDMVSFIKISSVTKEGIEDYKKDLLETGKSLYPLKEQKL